MWLQILYCFHASSQSIYLYFSNPLIWNVSPENVDLTSPHYVCNLPRTLKTNILHSSSQPSNKLLVANSQLAWTGCFQEIINFPCGKVNQGCNCISTNNLSRWLRDYLQFVISESFGTVIWFPIFANSHMFAASLVLMWCPYVDQQLLLTICLFLIISFFFFSFPLLQPHQVILFKTAVFDRIATIEHMLSLLHLLMA